MQSAPQFIFEAGEKPSLPLFPVPLVVATDDSTSGYGCLVDDPADIDIEIVRWPAQGWRPVDEGTGDEGGVVEGIFHGEWSGDILMGRNEAVGGNYVLGWSRDPQQASAGKATAPRDQVLLWHLNYHPDGGQLWIMRRSWCRWRWPATILRRKRSWRSGVTAARASIFIPASGTRVFSRSRTGSAFSTGRAASMPG